MGILAQFNDKESYFKVYRLSGDQQNGWTILISVAGSKEKSDNHSMIHYFELKMPWTTENIHEKAYSVLMDTLKDKEPKNDNIQVQIEKMDIVESSNEISRDKKPSKKRGSPAVSGN